MAGVYGVVGYKKDCLQTAVVQLSGEISRKRKEYYYEIFNFVKS